MSTVRGPDGLGEPEAAPPQHPFPDRRVAAVELAARLNRLRDERPVILALEPGGVLTGTVVAKELAAPLGVIAVARIGEPGRRYGAVAEGGPPIIDHDHARALGIDQAALTAATRRAEAAVVERQEQRGTALPDLVDRTVVVVGDGIATGRAAAAAGRFVRRRGATRVVAAAPIATARAMGYLEDEVDEIIVVRCTTIPGGLGDWYDQPLPPAHTPT